jgi:hypothetical protein
VSKNRALRRIDNEYNKDLKYPDINDYLEDTSYSTVTSNYHDDLIDTQLTYKMQDEVLTTRTIQVVNTPVTASFNAFVLYGYHPDLESVSEIRLTVDAFSDEDEATGKMIPAPFTVRLFNNRSRDKWSIILQSLIPNLGINKIVNYAIYLSDATVASLYQYVFNTASIREKVKKRYIHEDMYEDIINDDAKLVQFVKENLYTLSIPMRVEYFYFEDDEFSSFTFMTNFNMRPVLSKIRNTLKVKSLSVVPTTVGSSEYVAQKYFTWTAAIDNEVNLLPKYRIGSVVNDLNLSESIRFTEPTPPNQSTTVHTKFAAEAQQIAAHSGFRIFYPRLYVSYNWKFADNINVFIFSDVALKSPVSFSTGSVQNLTINNYFIGHNPILPYSRNNSVFKVSLAITLPPNTDTELLKKSIRKFQVEFFNDADNYSLLAGSLAVNANDVLCSFVDAGRESLSNDGSKTKYRVLAVGSDKLNLKMYSTVVADSTAVLNSNQFFNSSVAKFKARLDVSTGKLNLTLEWSDKTDSGIKYFWPLAYFSKIKVTLSDFFQRPIYQGQIEKRAWDVYADSDNPYLLFSLSDSDALRKWYPRGNNLLVNKKTTTVKTGFVSSQVLNFSSAVTLSALKTYPLVDKTTPNEVKVSYQIGLFCTGFQRSNGDKSALNDSNFIENAAIVVGYKKPRQTKYTYVRFDKTKHFVKNQTSANKVVSAISFDYSLSLVEITLNKLKLVNLIKVVGGISSGKGRAFLVPPFNLSSNKGEYFLFSHASGKYQSEVLFGVFNE